MATLVRPVEVLHADLAVCSLHSDGFPERRSVVFRLILRKQGDFSVNDVAHTLHYLLKMLQNMQRLDAEWHGGEDGAEVQVSAAN